MIAFFITRVRAGFELVADGHRVAVFVSDAAAASAAVRFAQDQDAPGYRIVY